MRLMRLADVPTNQGQVVFRHSPARALSTFVCVAGAITSLVITAWHRGSGLALYVAGVLLIGALIMQEFLLARFRPSNWLVRTSGEGLFLQFRSYLNSRLPSTDQTVVLIPYREIRSVSLVDERSEVPYRDPERPFVERSTLRRRRLVEIELSADTSSLERMLAEERARRPSKGALYRDHPVWLHSPSRLQVEWNVSPGAEEFLDFMRPRTNVEAPSERRQDYVDLAGLGRDEQENRLLQLIESGQTIEAVYLARKLYAYDLPQARDFIEGLGNGRNPK